MTRSHVRRVVIAIAVVAGFGLAGCATSPTTRFYVLTPVAPARVELSALSEGTTIGVRSVELPDALDRPQIVTRTGPNTLHYAEFHRWSGSLRDSVTQLIAENLATLLPADQVVAYPWTSVDRQVVVDITRFDGALDGRCVLEARWRVLGRRGIPPVYGHSTLTAVADGDYAALVATQSQLLGSLSEEIAKAILGAAPADAMSRLRDTVRY